MTAKTVIDKPKKGKVGRPATGKTTTYKAFCIPNSNYVEIVKKIHALIDDERRKMSPNALIYTKKDPALKKPPVLAQKAAKSAPKSKKQPVPPQKKEVKIQPFVSPFLQSRQKQKNGQ